MLWLYIYIHGRFSLFDTNMFSLVSWFLWSWSTCSKSTKVWSQIGRSLQNGLRFFLLFGKKYSLVQKLSFLINNFFGNIFQTPILKKYFNSWEKYFLVWHFIENQVFIISALFPCFSVVSFSLFKLMQLFCLVIEW